LFEVVLPKFRATISDAWNVREPDQILQLLANWTGVLPAEFNELILDQLVLASLRHAIENWDPRADAVPIHVWLHPWLPVFGDRLSVLYDPLIKKLASALQKWSPTDPSALVILKPWKGILTDRSWETLLLRAVVPKLLDGMKAFQINPANQDLTMFRAVLAWIDLIPLDHIVLLLDAQFFSKWLHTLQLWLSRSPNYDEVTQWYMAWKKLFPQALLQHERVQSRFAAALKMLDAAATKPGAITAPAAFVPPPDPIFRPITQPPPQSKTPGRDSPASASSGGSSAPRQQLSSDAVSFREVVERAAEEHDLLLLPTKKSHEGKPVFMLGNATVFLEREVVFQWKDGGWRPVSLEQLIDEQVARARKEQAQKR
jgi:tuftelin-interacting protein 11